MHEGRAVVNARPRASDNADMAFWNRSKAQGAQATAHVHSNAPRHWPAVELGLFNDQNVSLLMIGSQLAAQPNVKLAFLRDFVYEDGVLRVPLVVEENGVRTCVFVYTTNDTGAAAHYSGARALLKARENVAAVYYGPEALMPVKPADALAPIDTPLFSKGSEPNGEFALWWATPEDPLFSQSPDRALLDRWFETMNGYGYLLFSAFVNDLELVEPKEKRDLYGLPKQPFTQALKAPGDAAVLLHASAPEGLFLAFDQNQTPVATRRVLLTLLANFATKYREAIESKHIPPREDERGVTAWATIRDGAIAKEAAGGTGLRLHTISVRDGDVLRSPCAQTEAERASAPARPEREEIDFALGLVDRVVARLQKKPVEQSSQETLGEPNVFPIIAARAGGHVWERQLPFEDGEEAEAAAGRARDEWPDADIIAVLVDAAIRENGVRTDVFGVKVENAAGVAFDLIQRYKRSDAGGIELVGRPTVTPGGPFLLPPNTDPGTPPPGAELRAFAETAVDDIIAMLTAGEPSGMLGDDPEEQLLMPSALIDRGQPRPTLARFAVQGPITAAMSCFSLLEKEGGESVVYFLDDLVTKDGQPDRRLRLCVQRRGDTGAAIFEQPYEQPVKGRPFARRGELKFKRWGGSFLP